MVIEFTRQIIGEEVYKPGQRVNLPTDIATDFIKCGYAIPVVEAKAETADSKKQKEKRDGSTGAKD